MRVNVIGAILSIVFEDENGCVIPVSAVRDRFDYAAHRKIVVGQGSSWPGLAGSGTASMIIRQIEQYELRQFGSLPFCFGTDEACEFVEEFVGAKLIRIFSVEVGEARIEVIAQSRFSRMHAFKQRNWPRPRADRTMRVTDVLRQRLVFTNLVANAFGATRGSGSRGRQRKFRPLRLAPFSFDKFAIIAVSEVVARDVIPEEASRRVVYIGFANFQGIFVGYRALIVIYSLFATISDLPGLFVVIASDCRGRPIVPIARDLAAVIEVVEHTELQRQLVFVGSDVSAVHGER